MAARPWSIEAVVDDEDDFVASMLEQVRRDGLTVVRGPLVYGYQTEDGQHVTCITMEVDKPRNYQDRG